MQSSNKYNLAVNAIDRWVMWIAGLALMLMMVHISVDVVANLILGSPVPLTNATVTHYYMISVAYLPLMAGELRGAHISVDLVVNMMPATVRRYLDHLMQFVCMVVYGSLGVQAWQLAMEKLERDAFMMEQTSRVSTWPSYWIIPLGFALITLLLLMRLLCRVMGQPEPEVLAQTSTDESMMERHGDV